MINLDKWNLMYENNKRLDSIFEEKYNKTDPYLYEKNCIELLTELGEFANETKCFKYWSVKMPKKEECLEEYADCITILLYFFNILNIDIEFSDNHIESQNVLEVFNYIFSESTKVMKKCNEDLLRDLFNNLLYLGKLFDYSEEEILGAISKKHLKIEERLSSNDY